MARTISSYTGLHDKIKRLRGRAVEHLCDCGAQAHEWAYLGGDPNELVCPRRGIVFSLNIELYAPLCRPCHRQFDWVIARPACPQGHDYTPENTIREGGGRRRCRKCHYKRNRERYRRRRLEARKSVQASA